MRIKFWKNNYILSLFILNCLYTITLNIEFSKTLIIDHENQESNYHEGFKNFKRNAILASNEGDTYIMSEADNYDNSLLELSKEDDNNLYEISNFDIDASVEDTEEDFLLGKDDLDSSLSSGEYKEEDDLISEYNLSENDDETLSNDFYSNKCDQDNSKRFVLSYGDVKNYSGQLSYFSEKFCEPTETIGLMKLVNQKVSCQSNHFEKVENVEHKPSNVCIQQKINYESDKVVSELIQTWLWDSINPIIKYHQSPKASVGLLLDGNINLEKELIKRFALNLLLLHHEESIINMGHFKSCFGLMDVDKNFLSKKWPNYMDVIESLFSKDLMRKIGKDGDRNMNHALIEMMKHVNHGATQLNTSYKIVYLILNGKPNIDESLALDIKKYSEDKNIKIYAILLGEFDFCNSLLSITIPKRIFQIQDPFNFIFGKVSDDKPKINNLTAPLLVLLSHRLNNWSEETSNLEQNEEKIKRRLIPKRSYNFYGKLKRTWDWPRLVGKVNFGSIQSVETLFLMDSFGNDNIGMGQKLANFLINQFPIAISKCTIKGIKNPLEKPLFYRSVFTTREDVKKSITTLVPRSGRVTIVNPSLLYAINHRTMYFKDFINSAIFIILTHPVVDFRTFDDVGKLVKAMNLKLYILGIGLEAQKFEFIKLSTPQRVFTSLSFQGFFTSSNLQAIKNALSVDFGQNDIIPHLTNHLLTTIPLRSNPIKLTKGNTRISRPKPLTTSRRTKRLGSKSLNRRTKRDRISKSKPTVKLSTIEYHFRKSKQHKKKFLMLKKQAKNARGLRKTNLIKRYNNERKNDKDHARKAYNLARTFINQMESKIGKRNKRQTIEKPNTLNKYNQDKKRAEDIRKYIRRNHSYALGPQNNRRRPSSQSRQQPRLQNLINNNIVAPNPGLYLLPSTRELFLRFGNSIGKTNVAIVIDENISDLELTQLNQVLKAILVGYQRKGTYFTIITYGNQINVFSESAMLKNIESIDKIVSKIKRNTNTNKSKSFLGQALFRALRTFSSSSPGYPSVVLVFMKQKSSDDFLLPAIEIMKRGVRVIAMSFGDKSTHIQAKNIATERELAFIIDLSKFNEIPQKLIPILSKISGKALRNNKKSSLSTSEITSEWSWKVYDDINLVRNVYSSKIGMILDNSQFSQKITKYGFNIASCFSKASEFSLKMLGYGGLAAQNARNYKSYTDLDSLQYAFQGLQGLSFRRNLYLSRNRNKRSIIPNNYKSRLYSPPYMYNRYRQGTKTKPYKSNKSLFGKPVALGKDILNYKPFTSKLYNTQKQNTEYPSKRVSLENNNLNNEPFTSELYNSPNKMNDMMTKLKKINSSSQKIQNINDKKLQFLTRKIISNDRLLKSLKNEIDQNNLKTTNVMDNISKKNAEDAKNEVMQNVKSMLGPQLNKKIYSKLNNLVENKMGPHLTKYNSAYATLERKLQLQDKFLNQFRNRLRRIDSNRPNYQIKTILNRLRNYVGQRYSPLQYENQNLTSIRSWRNIHDHLFSMLNSMPQTYVGYTRIIFLILSDYPTNKTLYLQDFNMIQRRIKQTLQIRKIKLYVIIDQKSDRSNYRSRRELKYIADRFYVGNARNKLRVYSQIKQDLQKDYELLTFSTSFSVDIKSSSRKRIFNSMSFKARVPLLPPPQDTFISLSGLTGIQHYMSRSRYDYVLPSIIYNHLSGPINVIFCIDQSDRTNYQHTINAIVNIIQIFDKRFTRFSFVPYRSRPGRIYTNINFNSKFNEIKSNVTWFLRGNSRINSGQSNLGSCLRTVRFDVLKNLTFATQDIIILINRKQQINNFNIHANQLKEQGVTIASFSIGLDYNINQMREVVSIGQLAVGCSESLTINCLNRLEISLAAIVHGPKYNLKKVNYNSFSSISVGKTIFQPYNIFKEKREHLRERSKSVPTYKEKTF